MGQVLPKCHPQQGAAGHRGLDHQHRALGHPVIDGCGDPRRCGPDDVCGRLRVVGCHGSLRIGTIGGPVRVIERRTEKCHPAEYVCPESGDVEVGTRGRVGELLWTDARDNVGEIREDRLDQPACIRGSGHELQAIHAEPAGLEESRQMVSVVRMSQPQRPTVAQDSRGIVDPGLFLERATLTRYPPGPALTGLIEFFWVLSYELPEGMVFSQQVITHPCVNVSIAHGQVEDDGQPRPLEATLTGVTRQLYTRRIAGTGWAVAAKSTPGGFGAFIAGPVADLTDRVVPLGQVLDLDEPSLIAEIASVDPGPTRVAILDAHLTRLVEAADRDRKRAAIEVAEVAALAEKDRSLRKLADLAAASGIGARTLQRMFNEFVGISPTWVLRRYRLLEAAETVRHGQPVVWAQVAADLGYSDQAHLVRDFRAAVGTTPAAYAAQQSSF